VGIMKSWRDGIVHTNENTTITVHCLAARRARVLRDSNVAAEKLNISYVIFNFAPKICETPHSTNVLLSLEMKNELFQESLL
jgi:hypothetical protein